MVFLYDVGAGTMIWQLYLIFPFCADITADSLWSWPHKIENGKGQSGISSLWEKEKDYGRFLNLTPSKTEEGLSNISFL